MNLALLSQLNAENTAANLYFSLFHDRYRGQKRTPLSEMMRLAAQAKIVISPAEVQAFFDGLETAQVGQCVTENGEPCFVWIEKCQHVARMARRKSSEPLAANLEDEPLPEQTPIAAHSLQLRPDLTVTFQLPTDLTAQESKRLRHFLKAICS